MSGSLLQFSKELEDLILKVSASVMSVHTSTGTGSGFLITPDGYLISNAHVVQNHPQVFIESMSKDARMADVVGRDEKTDLALVKLRTDYVKDFLPLHTPEPAIGQLVVAVGNPLRFERTVTWGVVSAIHRQLPMPRGLLEGLIQTDASINPGNSGGPLVNMHGQVIGINTAIVPYAQGLGFAVSAATASWITSELMRFGRVRRKFLGIRGQPVQFIDDELNKQPGVHVLDLENGSAASLAGLKKDDIITLVNGTPVRFIDDLQKALALKEFTVAEIQVRRGKRTLIFYASQLRDLTA